MSQAIPIEQRLENIEARYRRLRWLVAGQLLLLALVASSWAFHAADARADAAPEALETLKVKELVVVDPRGVERVRIGGDLPDAVIDGKTVDRGTTAAGVLLYDASGQERSGYVTWDESNHVGLTLDSLASQVALFAAGPEGGPVMKLWLDEHALTLETGPHGPGITAIADGEQVFRQPPLDAVIPEACRAYREALAERTLNEVVGICAGRFGRSACRRCLQSED